MMDSINNLKRQSIRLCDHACLKKIERKKKRLDVLINLREQLMGGGAGGVAVECRLQALKGWTRG